MSFYVPEHTAVRLYVVRDWNTCRALEPLMYNHQSSPPPNPLLDPFFFSINWSLYTRCVIQSKIKLFECSLNLTDQSFGSHLPLSLAVQEAVCFIVLE